MILRRDGLTPPCIPSRLPSARSISESPLVIILGDLRFLYTESCRRRVMPSTNKDCAPIGLAYHPVMPFPWASMSHSQDSGKIMLGELLSSGIFGMPRHASIYRTSLAIHLQNLRAACSGSL